MARNNPRFTTTEERWPTRRGALGQGQGAVCRRTGLIVRPGRPAPLSQPADQAGRRSTVRADRAARPVTSPTYRTPRCLAVRSRHAAVASAGGGVPVSCFSACPRRRAGGSDAAVDAVRADTDLRDGGCGPARRSHVRCAEVSLCVTERRRGLPPPPCRTAGRTDRAKASDRAARPSPVRCRWRRCRLPDGARHTRCGCRMGAAV
jgi:hypothetical protein